ncbi:PREDICTED: uncharacterized protein LOC108374651 [Rhagoletis zephyria]|uniref:uncharacterized protein LOC108374651 n=1 Tax=Rhagoletis zephyria TaxID=28612 RepID=UPI0008112A07|nr:PREDICTED: uncharacterized protein LOC108374651 [Rhagoletis zephyria]
MISKCPSKSKCRVCQNSHHTALHRHISADNNGAHMSETIASQPPVLSLVSQSTRRALIPTALVLIKDKYGSFQTARALLDSCSEINFITEELAKRLQLGFQRNNQEISGIADVRTNLRFSVKTVIKSRVSSYEFTSDLAVTNRISLQQPEHCLDTTNWNLPEGIILADPLFYKPQKIDLLLGSQVFFEIFVGNNQTLSEYSPRLINTTLRWIVGGKLDSKSRSNFYTCNVATCNGLDTILKKFWELEDFAYDQVKYSIYTPEEQECENHFKGHAKVLANGRIQVSLPFKQSPNLLGESIDIAKRRFLQLELALNVTLH